MENTEEKILDAAMKVFSKEGYEGAKTLKIAREAGVSEVTLFRKFHSKENILKLVINRHQKEILQNLDSILLMEKDADVEICLQNLGKSLMQLMEERMDFIIMLMAEGRNRPEIAQLLNSFIKKLFEHLSEYFRYEMEQGKIREMDPEVLAFTLQSFIFYSALAGRIYDKNVLGDSEKSFEGFIDVLMRSILNLKCEESKKGEGLEKNSLIGNA